MAPHWSASPGDEGVAAAPGPDRTDPAAGSVRDPSGLRVRRLVADSWSRCQDRDDAREPGVLPSPTVVGDALVRREEHPMTAVLPICRELLGEAVRDSGSVFAVGDPNGVLLWVEGDPGARRRAERMVFVEGADWSEARAGTNAPGTALVVGAPVQIIGREHYLDPAKAWSCAAAPVRDPDTGAPMGVIDITGGHSAASPHALALVRATAAAVEGALSRLTTLSDLRAREAYSRRPHRTGAMTALVSPGGRVLASDGWLDLTALVSLGPCADTAASLPDGRRCVIEPVGTHGYVVIRLVESTRSPERPGTIRLTALGRDRAVVSLGGRIVTLSPRHSEIVMLLALASDEGLSASRLAVDLSADELSTATIRVDMSRLRRVLGEDVLGSQPYLLRRPVRSDVQVVRDLLAEGRVREAMALYAGPLLPASQAPTVVEHRSALEQQLRGALLGGRDAASLRLWVNSRCGADDLQAWEALARLLPPGSPQRASAAQRALGLTSDSRRRYVGVKPATLR